MNQSVINKILLARRFYELARENSASGSDLSLSIGVNLLQDAVETFLLAISEHVNANITSKTSFEGYFDLINQKINPQELPFRLKLIGLNKLRVNSKHYGLAPSKSEVEGSLVAVKEFFEEVATSISGKPLVAVSLIDLVTEGEAKGFLKAAREAFEIKDYKKCLIECRKALFVRIEYHYDIAPFETDDKGTIPGMALPIPYSFYCKAPFYARTKDYIEKNVEEPTDYIVYDHDDLEMELLKSGIDRLSYWNVWRLTPEVYRRWQGGEWVVKEEFQKLDEEGITEQAEYVLDTTINLFVAMDQKLKASRWTEHRTYSVRLLKEKLPIYEKADKASKVIGYTPEGLKELNVEYRVAALKGEGLFWKVAQFERGLGLWGYIADDDLKEA
jgi:hypothetical protein